MQERNTGEAVLPVHLKALIDQLRRPFQTLYFNQRDLFKPFQPKTTFSNHLLLPNKTFSEFFLYSRTPKLTKRSRTLYLLSFTKENEDFLWFKNVWKCIHPSEPWWEAFSPARGERRGGHRRQTSGGRYSRTSGPESGAWLSRVLTNQRQTVFSLNQWETTNISDQLIGKLWTNETAKHFLSADRETTNEGLPINSDQLIGKIWTNEGLSIISDQLIGKIATTEILSIICDQLIGRLWTNERLPIWSADREILNQCETANHFWSADRENLNQWETTNPFWTADRETFNQ